MKFCLSCAQAGELPWRRLGPLLVSLQTARAPAARDCSMDDIQALLHSFHYCGYIWLFRCFNRWPGLSSESNQRVHITLARPLALALTV